MFLQYSLSMSDHRHKISSITKSNNRYFLLHRKSVLNIILMNHRALWRRQDNMTSNYVIIYKDPYNNEILKNYLVASVDWIFSVPCCNKSSTHMVHLGVGIRSSVVGIISSKRTVIGQYFLLAVGSIKRNVKIRKRVLKFV